MIRNRRAMAMAAPMNGPRNAAGKKGREISEPSYESGY